MIRNKNKQCGHLRCGEFCRLGKKPKKIYRLKRSAPLKKKFYRIPKVSEKRKAEKKEYDVLREAFLKEHPICECGRIECKRGPSTDVHHSKGRAGSLYLDTMFWKALSRACHRWVELNPIEAKKLGLSVNRIE